MPLKEKTKTKRTTGLYKEVIYWSSKIPPGVSKGDRNQMNLVFGLVWFSPSSFSAGFQGLVHWVSLGRFLCHSKLGKMPHSYELPQCPVVSWYITFNHTLQTRIPYLPIFPPLEQQLLERRECLALSCMSRNQHTACTSCKLREALMNE